MLDKMPGDAWQKFASLRLLYTFMFTYPGKKLLFQGCEFAQGREWNFDAAAEWELLERPQHQGVKQIVADLNQLYRSEPALYQVDFESSGFEWIDCHDSSQSVLSYLRKSKDGKELVACAFNFTPVPRDNYRIGVPVAGFYREAINSDAELYGGSNVGNRGGVHSEPTSWMGRPHSIPLALPPLAGVVMVLDPKSVTSQDGPAGTEPAADRPTIGGGTDATPGAASAAVESSSAGTGPSPDSDAGADPGGLLGSGVGSGVGSDSGLR
jgi:1,4-alpha-glucan branching enzyme